jgi:hypothetical protein
VVKNQKCKNQKVPTLPGALRGWDGDDVRQLPGLELHAQALHREERGGSRAEADHHAALDVVIHGLVPHQLLQLILRRREA